MKTAVIKTGGKQYVVQEGDKLKVDTLPVEEGKKVAFDEVLFVAADESTTIGAPMLKGANVEGEVVTHGRHKKVVGVKMKAKKRYIRYFGHKQGYTEVLIKKIVTK